MTAEPFLDLLARTATAVGSSRELAAVLGISPRTLRRWRSGGTPSPAAAARARVVAAVVDQLRHVFTPAGVAGWFDRVHPELGERPIDLLSDPDRFAELLAVAASARAMPG